MAISLSGSTSISGLGGYDTDFDTVLAKLKQVESTKLNRLEAWKSDWNLRYEAFGAVVDQVSAASNLLSTLSNKNNFVSKNTVSSDENVVTAVASALAQDVQHTISVSQVASNAIWANTGAVFDSRTSVINTTGQTQAFRFNYGGKDYSIDIAPNTTLDSFASIVNTSTKNPGIKVSIIQAGDGYVYQISGKDTGADNDLIIYSSRLKGMDSTGSTSIWLTNDSLDPTAAVTNPSSFIYDIVLSNGAKKSISIKGDATADELVAALNGAAGTIRASIDSGTGDLLVDGVKSISRRNKGDSYTPGGLKVNVGPRYNDPLESSTSTDMLEFTVTLDDGNTRTFTIAGNATRKDFMVQLAQATQPGESVDISMDASGNWGVTLSGVASIAVTGGSYDLAAHGITTTTYAPTGTAPTQLASGPSSSTTTLTFDSSRLASRIDGKEASAGTGVRLAYTLTLNDGSAIYVDQKAGGGDLTSDLTNQDLLDAVKARLTSAGMSFVEGTDADGNPTLAMDGVQAIKLTTGSNGSSGYTVSTRASSSVAKNDVFYEQDGTLLLEAPPALNYSITLNDGSVVGVNGIDSGTSMQDIVARINAELAIADPSGETQAVLRKADGELWQPGDAEEAFIEVSNVQSVSGPKIKGQVAVSSNWSIQRAANAKFTVDNWPMEMESASNSLSDVVEGVVFNVQDVGTARISVSTDIASVEQSIQNFLDAVNSVLVTIRDFTAYDENKEVTSNDPKDIGKSNYSPSGLTSEKGGLLQGNYGVQLFKSRLSNLLSSAPPGFQSRINANDVLSGDVLATLANMGIKTDTDQNSQTYGLLVIAPSSSIESMQNMDMENYNNMITNNLDGLIEFFCASGTGSSSSSDFRYVSHVAGITKGGIYDVTYDVDANGNIGRVMVGGVEALRDESMPGNYYSVSKGDARGLSITIDDLTEGSHSGQVRIKQGLVQTINSFFKDELTFNNVTLNPNSSDAVKADVIALKSQNGALMTLRDNYKNIMENIDSAIAKEEYRLQTWEERQKAVFANLETLLNQYSQQQSSLEAQLKQLSNK